MTDKYFILDIIEGEDDRIGRIAIVRANPVKVLINGRMSASENIIGAELFFLPLDYGLVHSIIEEQNKETIWRVNPKDFKDRYVFFESENRRRLVHYHKSLYIRNQHDNWLKRIFRKFCKK